MPGHAHADGPSRSTRTHEPDPSPPFELSAAQRGIWFAQLLTPDVPISIAQYVDLAGDLDVDALDEESAAAARELGTGMLRIVEIDGEPFQIVDDALNDRSTRLDLRDRPDPVAAAHNWMRHEYATPIDVVRDRLIEAAILRVGERRWFWYARIHHIALDGFGSLTFMRRVAERYSARVAHRPPPPHGASPLRELLDDGIYRTSTRFESDREYWRTRTQRLPAAVSLAQRGAGVGLPTRTASAPLGPATDLAVRRHTGTRPDRTFATLAIGAVAAYLARLTGETDIVLTLPVAARTTAKLRRSGGMVSNAVPLRLSLPAGTTIGELLAQVQTGLVGALRHQRYRYEDICRDAGIGDGDRGVFGPLINVMMFVRELSLGGIDARVNALTTGPIDDLSINIYPGGAGEPARVDFEVNPNRYTAQEARAHLDRFLEFLAGFAAAPDGASVDGLEVLHDDERAALVPYLHPAADPPRLLPDLLTAGVASAPDAVAIRAGGLAVDYRRLDAESNRLARLLIAAGAGPETVVALYLPRSAGALLAVWAVAKTGAAFLPLDPALPAERIAWMLTDSGAALGLVAAGDRIPDGGTVRWFAVAHDLTVPGTADHRAEPIRDAERRRPLRPGQVAYLIYTSGSTGRPKGVAVTHAGLARFAGPARPELDVRPGSRVLRFSSASFDASVFEMIVGFSAGATLVVAPADLIGGAELTELLRAERITHIVTAPTVLSTVDPAGLDELAAVVVGGDVCTPDLVERFAPVCRFTNSYGPTETTIVVTTGPPLTPGAEIPIGTPIAGVGAVVLDRRLRPLPVGVVGELYLSGPGLARGYHGRPGLTATRFVADPYGAPGGRMYASGDEVRWRQDHQLDFIGRSDLQVKVRGFRIELSEIDAAICAQPGIEFAATVAHPLPSGARTLASYVVTTAGTDLDADALRAAVARTLPAYMVPGSVTRLDRIPVTSAGKLDRNALPQPQLRTEHEYRGPSGEVETALAEVAAAVLGVDRVSVDASLFGLGVDSIAAIQLVAGARARGLVLTAREVFEHRTIAEIARYVRRSGERADNALAELPGGGRGEIPATPIIRTMLDRGYAADIYQAVLVGVPDELTPDDLAQALAHVVSHHDMLRARFVAGAPATPLDTAADPVIPQVTRADPVPDRPVAFAAAVRAECAAAVARLAPERGVLLQAVWFGPAATRGSRLLLVAHHLVVDGVSWRILIADLAVAAAGPGSARPPALPAVGTSFRRWAHALASTDARGEAGYWRDIASTPQPRFGHRAVGPGDLAGAREHTVVQLSAADTETVLSAAPELFGCGVQDVLAAALAMAVVHHRHEHDSDERAVLLTLEGHGREESVVPGSELSRTVGWFTTAYPVRLIVPGVSLGEAFAGADAAGTILKAIKEQLRAVPSGGIGYGVLRYLDETTAAEFAGFAEPEIGINYLGRFDAATGGAWLPDPAVPDLHAASGRTTRVGVALDINAAVAPDADGPRLAATFSYPPEILSRAEAAGFADLWRRAIEALASHARRPGAGGLTPSDLMAPGCTQAEVDRWQCRFRTLRDVWPVTPLQAGLLYHAAAAAPGDDTYLVQLRLDLDGPLDLDALRAAATGLLAAHENLRAGFGYDERGTPVQWILDELEPAVRAAEVSGPDPDAGIERELAAERAAGFTVGVPPLLRLTVIRTDSARTVLAVTNHHLLLDGWSMPLLVHELLVRYAGGQPPREPRPFKDHLAWLRGRTDSGRDAWSAALAGIDEPTLLGDGSTAGGYRDVPVPLAPGLPRALTEVARRADATLNTVVQAAWAVVLSRLVDRDDVVFGATVSGRPPELTGADRTLGLFINTLPVRVRIDEREAFAGLVSRIRREQTRLLDHQHVDLAGLQDAVGMGPLFDTLTVFESYPVDRDGLQRLVDAIGLRVLAVDATDPTHYPVTVTTVLDPELRIVIRERPSRLPAGAAVAEQLAAVLAAGAAEPATAVGALGLPDRRHAVSVGPPDLLPPATLAELTAAAPRPELPDALVFGARTLSLAEFDARVARAARYLIAAGIGPESRVAVALDRSIELVVWIHAVVLSGGAYVPVDPSQPATRVAHVLRIAAVDLVLAEASNRARLSGAGGAPADGVATDGVVAVDSLALEEFSGDPVRDADRRAPLRPAHAAYVLFTSGSTGEPKGVTVSHAAIVNRLRWMQDRYPLGTDDAVLLKTPVTFDVSVWELFWPTIAGTRLVVAEPDGHLDPRYLAALMCKERISALHFVPSMLDQFRREVDPGELASVRHLFTSGEALSAATAADVLVRAPGIALHNLYGPTEAAVDVTAYDVAAGESPIPIGTPVPNTGSYVLGHRLHPTPAGFPGELYLSGVQLARGYLNRPGPTAAAFVADPYGAPGSRMYRTGDRVRWSGGAAPVLLYLGRRDQQIKLRGQRIELGEIEAALRRRPAVAECAVVLRDDAAGGRYLAAYAVPAPGQHPDPAAVLDALTGDLPAAMIPATLHIVDALPLGSSGKLDRKALAASAIGRRDAVAPATPTERALAGLLGEITGDAAGVPDTSRNLVELGINSLTATRLLARINQRFEVGFTLRDLFEATTVEALAGRIDAAEPAPAPVRVGPTDGPAPLSPAQHRMWLIDRFDPGSSAYHVAVALRLSGDLDADALRAAVFDVVERHAALRTIYPDSPTGPVQRVLPLAEVADPMRLTGFAGAATEPAAFDLATRPPFAVTLTHRPVPSLRSPERAAGEHVVTLTAHHIAVDGWSLRILAADLVTAYTARRSGGEPPWAAPAIGYTEYARHKHAALGDPADPRSLAARDLAFWTHRLAGVPDLLELPADRPRPATASGRGAAVTVPIDPVLHRDVTELAERSGVTPFAVFHTAFAVLLARLSGAADLVIGSPVSGRGDARFDDVVGMFVNTLALRSTIDPAASFADTLAEIRAADLAAFAHADLPFERVVEALHPARATSHHPVYQAVLALGDDTTTEELELPGLRVTVEPLPRDTATVDLQLVITEHRGDTGRPAGADAELTYARDLFDAATVADVARRLIALLRGACADPATPVGDLELLAPGERAALLRPPVPAAPRTLPALLRAAAATDGPALIADGVRIGYAELDARSNRLARLLIERGAGPERFVAILAPRSVSGVLAIWAVAKTGAAFVPVDPAQPPARIATVLADSGATLGITVSGSTPHPDDSPVASPAPAGVDWLVLDDLAVLDTLAAIDAGPIDRPDPHPAHPAYLIYTSGSTGTPKGVVLTHAGLAGFVAEQRDRYRIPPGATTLLFASPSFDASLLELFLAVGAGAAAVVVPPAVRGGAELGRLIREHGVAHLFLTPGGLSTLDPADLVAVRTIVVGGEACDPAAVRRWAPGRAMFNAYGPTEATIMATQHGPLRPDEPVAIGTAVRGAAVAVLDPRLHPVPRRVTGELYVSGAGLARGYLGRPGPTASVFVADPNGAPGTRMYRTGDLARWTGDALEYQGRSDFQVKIRGHRVELGEIDAALAGHPDVDTVVTVARDTPARGTIAVAYVVPAAGRSAEPRRLTEHLRRLLPGYQIPAAIVPVDALPLTTGGKLDTAALPEPVFASHSYVAPRTDAEARVAAAIGEVLGIDRVGAEDDFFALGGDSLSATRVVARLGAAAGGGLPVAALFENPTVAGLAGRLAAGGAGDPRPALHRSPRPARIPLSAPQQRMWFLNRFDPDSSAYTIPVVLELRGDLDPEVLQAAVDELLDRHEILRTRFPDSPDGPYQQVLAAGALDLSPAAPDGEPALGAAIAGVVTPGFDVTRAVPLRAGLFRAGPDRWLLALAVHHILADGASVGVLAADLAHAYLARRTGTAPAWPPLPVQYADYALWQAELLGPPDAPSALADRQLGYWRDRLAGLPAVLELPTDRPRPSAASRRGARVGFAVDAELTARLRDRAAERGATLFMVLHAALAALLARLSGTADIAIGTPVAGRGLRELDGLIGMFVNTLVLRTEVDTGASFAALLDRVRATDLAAFEHAELPFERVVDALDPPRSPAYSPLFQVALAMQNASAADLALPGLTVSALDPGITPARFDLEFTVTPGPDGLAGALTYATDLFDAATATRLTDRLITLLRQLAAGPDAVVGEVDLLTDAEHARLAGPVGAAAPVRTLAEILAGGAALDPDAIAVRANGTELSYAELDARSAALAGRLAELGVGPETPVASALPRSIEAIVALWAVARSGGVLVPVDPRQPASRTAALLADAGVTVGLTTPDHLPHLPPDIRWEMCSSAACARFPPLEGGKTRTGAAGAYLIFTSGSTGRPKGVVVTQAGLASFCADARRELGLDRTSRMLRLSAPVFDASMFETIAAFSAGATMVVAPEGIGSGAELRELLRAERITHVITAPAMLAGLAAAGLDDLRTIVVGGDVCTPELVSQLAPGRRFHNSYGPTETTIVVTLTEPLRPGAPIGIGRPLPGVHAQVLDRRLRPVPAGVVGELYLAWPGLARGYHRRPGLTAAAFVADPDGTGRRMYRTGDLVRWTPDGDAGIALDFVARADAQVQLRGIRVEPAEIETALLADPAVALATVVLATDEHTGQHLVGYVVPEPGAALEPADLRAALRDRLPAHLVPAAIVVLDRLPMSAAGKVDRAALPAPEFGSGRPFRAPGTPTERRIAGLFGELLGRDAVSVDDSFFELGGHSLLASRLAARISAELGAAIDVRTLFEHPTVSALADLATHGPSTAGLPQLVPAPDDEPVPLSAAQQRMWFLNRYDPDSAADNIPLMLWLRGDLDRDALRRAIGDVVERHATLRTVYPDDDAGPRQLVRPATVPDLDPIDVSPADLPERLLAAAAAPFDVTTEIPVRLQLFRVDADQHVLALVLHHIAADGFSTGILARDLALAYAARHAGSAPGWAPLPIGYTDYSVWQHAVLGAADDPGSVAARQTDHWTAALAGIDDQLPLPTDHPRPRIASQRGATVSFTIPAETRDRLQALATGQGATLFMALHAGFAALLGRWTGVRDVVIGAPIAGRGARQLDDVVGMFVNTLALRAAVPPDRSFEAVLAGVRAADTAAFANADVPFERLVEVLDPPRSAARHPIFQVAFSFHNLPDMVPVLGGLTVEPVDPGFEPAKFDLHLTVLQPAGDGPLRASLTYATDLFERASVAALAERFRRVLDTVTTEPARPIGDLELTTAAERRALLAVNRTGHSLPPVTLPELLADRIARTPDPIALVHHEIALSYAELGARVNRWARELIATGVGPGDTVLLAMPRSIDLVVAMYAVSTAGAAYVPVDPAQPAGRLARIAGSARPALLLAVRATTWPDELPVARLDVDAIDVEHHDRGPVTDADRIRPLHPADLAYLIFTSGSTGTPKGVEVSHAAIANQLRWKQAHLPLTESDALVLKTAATFDLSVWEFWSAAPAGARLVLADPGTEQDPAALGALLREQRITAATFVPTLLSEFLDTAGDLGPLQQLWCIGETLPGALAHRALGHRPLRLFNLYGPTEAAVSVTVHRCTAVGPDTVPIGLPQWNTQVFVLDDRLHPVPPGAVGELYLAGAQLARGYAGDPGLSATTFVANPFDTGPRMYRTGDLARWVAGPDGIELHHVGRADLQIKLRGQRIELGDLETALAGLPGVHTAAATVVGTAGGDHLVGYVVGDPGLRPDELRAACAERLPGYLVPSVVVPLAELPTSAHGKLDRAALPVPDFLGSARYRPPAPGAQQIVAGIVADLVGASLVGADDSFFELGGTSLLAARLIARCNAAFGTAIGVRTVFDTPTVAGIAAALTAANVGHALPALGPRPRPDRVPLTPAQERTWSGDHHQVPDNYWNLPVAVRLRGALDRAALSAAAADVVDRHESLRTRYPMTGDGPAQVVVPTAEAIPPIEVVSVDPASLDSALVEFVTAGFDVQRQLPIRLRLFELAADDHLLAAVVHHIAADGHSLGVLTRDVALAYAARSVGVPPAWTGLPVQFIDYALWRHEILGDPGDPASEAARQLAYWTRTLDGRLHPLPLPTDRPRPARRSTAGAWLPVTLNRDTHTALVAVSRRTSASLFVVLQAAFAACLADFGGVTDVTVATSLGNRGEPLLDDVVGNFSDDVLLRIPVPAGGSFETIVAATREAAIGGFAHPDVANDRIARAADSAHADGDPLYQAILILQPGTVDTSVNLTDLRIDPYPVPVATARHELEFALRDHYDEIGRPAGITGALCYATDIYDAATAQRIVDSFRAILIKEIS